MTGQTRTSWPDERSRKCWSRGQGHAGQGGKDKQERGEDGQGKGDHKDAVDEYKGDGNRWSNGCVAMYTTKMARKTTKERVRRRGWA